MGLIYAHIVEIEIEKLNYRKIDKFMENNWTCPEDYIQEKLHLCLQPRHIKSFF